MKHGKLATLGLQAVCGYHECMPSTSLCEQRRTTWFVSRHAGAIAWAKGQELTIGRWATHLDPAQVEAGDTVIGTLPVNLAAEVCQRGALYFHLSLNVPMRWRGRELSSEELHLLMAHIAPFHIEQPISYLPARFA